MLLALVMSNFASSAFFAFLFVIADISSRDDDVSSIDAACVAAPAAMACPDWASWIEAVPISEEDSETRVEIRSIFRMR
jgi:hypothetical protein